MASVYKPTRIDSATGKRVKCLHWRIAYVNEHGKRVTVKGYKDKKATEEKARELERNVERRKVGLPVAEALQARPFPVAVDAYLAELRRRGCQARRGGHVNQNQLKLHKLAKECGWTLLGQVSAEGFGKWLAGRAALGMAPGTMNGYQAQLKGFLSWCVEQGWLEVNPLLRLKPAKVGQKGRRRLRRAYTLDEFRRLLAVSPEPRRTVYAVAALSGLRRNELAQLTRQDCTPSAERPHWHLRPEITKNGLAADLPMLPECARLLEPLWERAQPAEPILARVPHVKTLYSDLRRAGIPRQDGRGKWADFHSFRYFFCVQVGSILPIQKVRLLMRHSTIKLTADLYTDLGIDDLGAGVWSLPPLFEARDQAAGDQGQADTPGNQPVQAEGQAQDGEEKGADDKDANGALQQAQPKKPGPA